MDIAGWHEAFARDAETMASAAEAAPDLTAPVPSCPGWTVADLVYHMGEVLAFWTTIVRDEVDDPETITMPSRPADADLAPWFRGQIAETSRVLRTSDPAAPCWTWSDYGDDVAFVIRRMAHEIAVHCWDLLDALGRRQPVEATLASDGIDEFLQHFSSWPKREWDDLGGTAHLHCTDVAGEWLVTQDGGRLEFTREHAKGSCALRGAASDLLLVMWRRLPLESVEVIGDAEVAARFVAWTGLN